MSNYDRYYASKGLVSRNSGEPQTTFQEEELVRVASRTTSGGVMTDGSVNRGPGYSPRTRTAGVARSSSAPRIPRRHPFSSQSSLASVGRRSPQSSEREDGPRRVPSKPKFLSRGGSDSDDDTFTDNAVHTIKSAPPYDHSTMPVYPSKTAPVTTASYYSTTKNYTMLPDSTELMETTVPNSPSATTTTFNAQKYQRHLVELQQQAVEQNRLQQGLSLLLPNNDGDTGLHQAIIHNQTNMVYHLLELINKYPELHSSIDDQNGLYQTPLHLAAHLQQVDVIKQLLSSGASPFLQDHKGNTPLHVACSSTNTKGLEELLHSMNQLNISRATSIRNYMGQTCVHIAVLSGNKEGLKLLERVGVDMNLEEYRSGKTPLHLAVETGSFQMVQLLVRSCKADHNSKTFSGCTPLHMAAGRGQLELVAYLISLGADPCALTDEGDTPQDLAVDRSVQQFLETVVKTYYC